MAQISTSLKMSQFDVDKLIAQIPGLCEVIWDIVELPTLQVILFNVTNDLYILNNQIHSHDCMIGSGRTYVFRRDNLDYFYSSSGSWGLGWKKAAEDAKKLIGVLADDRIKEILKICVYWSKIKSNNNSFYSDIDSLISAIRDIMNPDALLSNIHTQLLEWKQGKMHSESKFIG